MSRVAAAHIERMQRGDATDGRKLWRRRQDVPACSCERFVVDGASSITGEPSGERVQRWMLLPDGVATLHPCRCDVAGRSPSPG